MKDAVINIKTDKRIKLSAQKVAREIGIPLSSILNAYLRELTRTKHVTFSIAEVRPEVGRALLQASRDYKKEKNISPKFDSVDEGLNWLDSSEE